MAFDQRECVKRDGVPAGLTGFRLWGFVGILVRRPGFWPSPFAGRAGEGWSRSRVVLRVSGAPASTSGLVGAGTGSRRGGP